MPGLSRLGVVLAICLAALYQLAIKDLLFVTLGVGRSLQPVSEFPYRCHRLRDPRLAGCEDAWLSTKTRTLYLACSDPVARSEWMPNVGRLNVSGRALDDAIIAMDIDQPVGDGHDLKIRVLETIGMPNATGKERLHLVGLTGVDNSANVLLYLVNNRPSIDPDTGAFLDNAQVGANSTIELFQTAPRASAIMHLKTFAHPLIATPNNIAVVGPDAFYFTNDHGPHKVGLQHRLSPFLGTGDVTFCRGSACARVSGSSRLKFPNGLLADPRDGRVYVPSAWAGGVTVWAPRREQQQQHHHRHQSQERDASASASSDNDDGALILVATIPIPYPIDNLAMDARGDIYAAALPRVSQLLRAFNAPLRHRPAATVLRIRREQMADAGVSGSSSSSSSSSSSNGYVWEKVLEDRDGEVLPAATTAVHDAATGRLFLMGVVAPFVTVCEPVA